jgi:phosphatidylethanolamine N-methyltransferase
MVSQLLDPRQPKNLSDVAVLAILALHIAAAYFLPWSLKRPVFAAIFLFWRASYNVGIGFLLTVQSNHKLLVTWAKRWKLFENPATGKNPRPWLYKLLKHELEAKIPVDYRFEQAPIEYNTWLVFRRVVDLILMCDFVSYCLFAIVCGHKLAGEALPMTVARWVTGIALVGFNLWVKLDAHRVVKDYAWYWGGRLNMPYMLWGTWRLTPPRLLLPHRTGAHVRRCVRDGTAPYVLHRLCGLLRYFHDGR